MLARREAGDFWGLYLPRSAAYVAPGVAMISAPRDTPLPKVHCVLKEA